jgi:hypothetical protein
MLLSAAQVDNVATTFPLKLQLNNRLRDFCQKAAAAAVGVL